MAILITGANGQIGSELVSELAGAVTATDPTVSMTKPDAARHKVTAAHLTVPATKHDAARYEVVATDLTLPSTKHDGVTYDILDVTDRNALRRIVEKHRIDTIYHLASLLSVTSEKDPDLAWDVNINGLKHVLELARERGMKIFWPSSIAVFGRATPKRKTPQTTILDPGTIYGVTKVSGEFLCRYYHDHFGVDVRSLRYPGLISYKTAPGGGTTDYAVEVFYAACDGSPYECFVGPDTRLPMMYMSDAIRGAIDLMHAPAGFLTVHTSYNVSAVSFTAGQLVEAIQKRMPGFEVVYRPDRRQRIADSWPSDVDDLRAREDWGWRPAFTLDAIVDDMLAHMAQPGVATP